LKSSSLVAFTLIIVLVAGLGTPAFAITQKATFYTDCEPDGTTNPFVGDPKTHDYADLVLTKPQTIRGGTELNCAGTGVEPTNLDESNPGGFPAPEKILFLDTSTTSFCFIPFNTGDIVSVAKGYEEGEFAFTGLNPSDKFLVTVVLSDIDDCGIQGRLASDPNDPLGPVRETVFVNGNGVELGFVDAAGFGPGDHVVQKQFAVLAMADGSGDLDIGFNTVTDFNPNFYNTGFGVEQIVIESTSEVPVGGDTIKIDTTSLMVAGAQSFSWMIPVVLSGIGIGLFVVSRKSKNS
jgi:hypothetical protein